MADLRLRYQSTNKLLSLLQLFISQPAFATSFHGKLELNSRARNWPSSLYHSQNPIPSECSCQMLQGVAAYDVP